MNTKKQALAQVIEYLQQENEDKQKMLKSFADILETSIPEEQALVFIINNIYQTYIKDNQTYTEVFNILGINMPTQESEELTVADEEEKPKKTKKEIELEEKEEELETDLNIKEKSLDEEVEEYEANSFKEKMKNDSGLSVLDKLKRIKM